MDLLSTIPVSFKLKWYHLNNSENIGKTVLNILTTNYTGYFCNIDNSNVRIPLKDTWVKHVKFNNWAMAAEGAAKNNDMTCEEKPDLHLEDCRK